MYGKGGIGKSCTASNTAAACAEEGHRVLVVGCDPKSDSSITLVGRRIPTMMDLVLYDVPGDIVCGGFSAPIRNGLVSQAYIITSGEYMPLYAANNISKGLRRLKTPLAGVICNSREAAAGREKEIVERFAQELNSRLVAFIPKDPIVQLCERKAVTVIEGAPNSQIAKVYRSLAREIMLRDEPRMPEPLSDERLRELSIGMSKDIGSGYGCAKMEVSHSFIGSNTQSQS